jgi:hypothetical protein
VGEVIGIENEAEKELLVEFHSYPCPAGPETAWICPEHWLMPLEDPRNRMIIIQSDEPQFFTIT